MQRHDGTRKVRDSLKAFLQRLKALDELPDEVADDALEMAEEVADALSDIEMQDEEADILEVTSDSDVGVSGNPEAIDKVVQDAVARALRKAGLVTDNSMEAIDELEAELETDNNMYGADEDMLDADGEEVVTTDPEKMNDSVIRRLLREMKPAIARVGDSRQRRALSNALAKAARMKTGASYSGILSASRSAVKDSKPEAKQSDDAYGMDVAKRFNPHYKQGGN